MFFVTEERLLRGFDYRRKYGLQGGLALLLAKSCSSESTYQQAIGRVGRFGEESKRFILQDVEKVDVEADMKN